VPPLKQAEAVLGDPAGEAVHGRDGSGA